MLCLPAGQTLQLRWPPEVQTPWLGGVPASRRTSMQRSITQHICAAVVTSAGLGSWSPVATAAGHGHASHGGRGAHSGAGQAVPGHGTRGAGVAGVQHPSHYAHSVHGVHGVGGGHLERWRIAPGAAYLYGQPGYLIPDAYAQGGKVVEPSARHFCNVLQGYYPEVQSCPEPWMIVVPGAR